MGRIGDFFYHLTITILVAAALVFLLMAFKEQYPILKNQQELEDNHSCRSSISYDDKFNFF